MYTMVRFFSLLFRLFLLERGAKREKQPPLPDYFCFRRCSNYCAWKVFFALVLWWSQFECEKNRIPWKTFRILSLRLSYSVRKSSLFPALLSFASFESAREELQLSDAFIVVIIIRGSIISTTTEEHQHHQLGERKSVKFLSRFLLFFLLLLSCSRSLSSHFFCSWAHTPQ